MLTLPDACVLLIGISGHDKPGVTHSVTDVPGHFKARILDIGQAVTTGSEKAAAGSENSWVQFLFCSQPAAPRLAS